MLLIPKVENKFSEETLGRDTTFGDARWVACFLLLENHTHINGYILNNRSKVRTGVRSYTDVLLCTAYQLY